MMMKLYLKGQLIFSTETGLGLSCLASLHHSQALVFIRDWKAREELLIKTGRIMTADMLYFSQKISLQRRFRTASTGHITNFIQYHLYCTAYFQQSRTV